MPNRAREIRAAASTADVHHGAGAVRLASPVRVDVFETLPTEVTSEQGVLIRFEPSDREMLDLAALAQPAGLAEFDLSLRAVELASQPGFDRLICLPMVRDMEVLDHQVKTAKSVLRQMRGRALLCDEVGLGKTIEAGLILSELMMRGLVRSMLVLTPPSLVEQWRGELARKFRVEMTTLDDPAWRLEGGAGWSQFDRMLASYHTAKRSPHRQAIQARMWDLIIVDEAHHLRNSKTQLWQFVSQIPKRFILLLTATPVQNNLEELFNLVTLLEPGLLSTAKRFQSRFVDRQDKLAPRNVTQLHELLAEVMVRNRRNTVGLEFTRRWARTERIVPSPPERQLYQDVAELVRRHLATAAATTPASSQSTQEQPLSRMALMTLQMELGSSAAAAAGTLEKLAQGRAHQAAEQARLTELAAAARRLGENTKTRRLLSLLDELDDKLVVFTQFRATQEMLREALETAGHEVALFHGGLGRLEKERQIALFRNQARVLLTTDSGSEGRNLQFCNAICNFDLPWNPMRIEQRIGRLSRIGQSRDVHVINFVATGTIEAAILHLLEAKLAMFELVIGEIDMVLGNLDDDREFPDMIADLWAQSTGLEDFALRMEQLGDRLVAAKQTYLQQRGVEDRLFGDQFRPKD